MTLVPFPNITESDQLECDFGGSKSQAVIEPGKSITCSPPEVVNIPQTPESQVEVKLTFKDSRVELAVGQYRFYDCSAAAKMLTNTPCASCVTSEWRCQWNIKDHKCSENDAEAQDVYVIKHAQGKTFKMGTELMGSTEVEIVLKEDQTYEFQGYEFSYDKGQMRDLLFYVKEGSNKIDSNLNVTLYNCSFGREDCSLCKAADPKYGCVWCSHPKSCLYSTTCPREEELCPMPKILDIEVMAEYKNETELQFHSPVIPEIFQNHHFHFHTVIVLDNVEKTLQTFKYYPDPTFNKNENGIIPFEKHINIKGERFTSAMTMQEAQAYVGDAECTIEIFQDNSLLCKPPETKPQVLFKRFKREADASMPEFLVKFGAGRWVLGKVNYDSSTNMLPLHIILPVVIIPMVAIIAISVYCYRRQSQQAERDYEKVRHQLENLEESVRDRCKKEFTDLMIEMEDHTSDLNEVGIPFLDYKTYTDRVFFLPSKDGVNDVMITGKLDIPAGREQTVSLALNQFSNLLNSKPFLINFIRTLESQRDFNARSKVYFASLLTVALHGKLEYYTDIMNTLLLQLMDQYVAKNPKLMLRRWVYGDDDVSGFECSWVYNDGVSGFESSWVYNDGVSGFECSWVYDDGVSGFECSWVYNDDDDDDGVSGFECSWVYDDGVSGFECSWVYDEDDVSGFECSWVYNDDVSGFECSWVYYDDDVSGFECSWVYSDDVSGFECSWVYDDGVSGFESSWVYDDDGVSGFECSWVYDDGVSGFECSWVYNDDGVSGFESSWVYSDDVSGFECSWVYSDDGVSGFECSWVYDDGVSGFECSWVYSDDDVSGCESSWVYDDDCVSGFECSCVYSADVSGFECSWVYSDDGVSGFECSWVYDDGVSGFESSWVYDDDGVSGVESSFVYFLDSAGESLYKLFKAIKHQVEKGPVDGVLKKAKYTLNDTGLLGDDVEYCTLTLQVLVDGEGPDICAVKVLNCDTISQVKEKIIDQVYRNMPYSQRPKVDRVVLGNALLEDDNKVWHLARSAEDVDESKSKRGSMKDKGSAKAITEIYLTRLLSVKQFVDNFFRSVLCSGAVVPPAVKYFFDFLDEQAAKHDNVDEETVHIWKTNSLPLRFWVNILKNPHFIFDVHVHETVDASLSVIAQTFMDACTKSEHKLSRLSLCLVCLCSSLTMCPVLTAQSVSRVSLFLSHDVSRAHSLPLRFWVNILKNPHFIFDVHVHEMVDASLSVIAQTFMDACTKSEHKLSRAHTDQLNTQVALHQLYQYASKYYDEIINSLEEDPATQNKQLTVRLQQIAAALENKVTDL
ncbi:UNVERIFIED_CONTAM: hypothetical protein FKN15_059764 [Acipenser sinensis]